MYIVNSPSVDIVSFFRSKEQGIKNLEIEIDQQRRMTESMVADMVSFISFVPFFQIITWLFRKSR